MSEERIGRWGAIAHVFLAVALALPVVGAALVLVVSFVNPDQTTPNRWLLGFLALLFVVVVVVVALLPVVRQVEVATARSLLGVDLPDVVDPRAWPGRRRAAAWLGLLVLVGALVAVLLLGLLPIGVGLIAQPLTGQDTVQVPGLGRIEVGAGWAAAWLVVPGLLALLVVVAVVLGSGSLLRRLAPSLLGASSLERAILAESRERDLAARNELAREVHDTLGHSLTAMTLQAGAARRLIRTDPAAADQALRSIEEVGRQAQADVDGVVGALRGRVTAPGGGRRDLRESLRPLLRDAPLQVEVSASTPVVADAALEQTAYRTLQEALTNAARHGTGSASVQIRDHGDAVELEVRNPVAGSPGAGAEGRHGLHGLRERLLLVGGVLDTRLEEDTWVLTARLPR